MRGRLLIDVWADEEAVIGDPTSERVYRITAWRIKGREVDVDGPHEDLRPGLYTREEAEALARAAARALRRRRMDARVASADGRHRILTASEVRRNAVAQGWIEGVDDREEDRIVHSVSPEVVRLESGRPVPGWIA